METQAVVSQNTFAAEVGADSSVASQSGSYLEGDFAAGCRGRLPDTEARGDFATGVRSGRMQMTLGSFATGMATLRGGSLVCGDFATGQRIEGSDKRPPRARLRRSTHPQQSEVGAVAQPGRP